jgi:hypothetical protein
MTPRQRLRNAGQLCLHCLRNIAYYRASQAAIPLRGESQFWRTAENNFLDIAVLEWCKLFADQSAKHHWRKVVTDQDKFLSELLVKLSITEDIFNSHVKEMRTYRDKFIAHLDEQNVMQIPQLDIAINSCQFLYQWILRKESQNDTFYDAPADAEAFYNDHLSQGKEAYALRRLRH